MIWTQWQLLRIDLPNETFYKVFVTSYRDMWRLNSGIVAYNIDEDVVTFVGDSGSQYRCYIPEEGNTHWSCQNVLDQLISDPDITKISFDDFRKQFKG